MNISARTIVKLVLAAIAGIVTFRLVPAPLPELSRAEFMHEVHAGHVRKVEIEDEEVILSESTTRGPFRTAFDKTRDAALSGELKALGNRDLVLELAARDLGERSGAAKLMVASR